MDGYGDAEKMRLAEVNAPRPGPDETLIRVGAIGVNPADPKWRSGMFADFAPLSFPHIPGYEVAGVAQTGPSAGRRVAAMLDSFKQGAYAEYAVVASAHVAELPQALTLEAAAAVPTPGLTGVQMVEDQLDVREGQLVLITGAAGAVGRFAVQAAKTRGARVVAAVRAGQRETARRLGADQVVALGEQDWTGEPFDAVGDTVGGPAVAVLCRRLSQRATIVTVATTPIPADGLATLPSIFAVRPDGPRLARLLEAVAAGEIDNPVARVLPLEQAAEAQRLVEAGSQGGKIVLRT